MVFFEKTDYFLRENISGREDKNCCFSCEFGESSLHFYFDVKDEDLISPFEKDNQDLWEGDAVEVFLSPDGDLKRYKEIEVSPFGVRFYGDITNEDGKSFILKREEPAYKAVVRLTKEGYTASIEVAYHMLKGFDRTKMKLNAFRLDKKSSGEQLLYALNPTWCESFHRPVFFIGEGRK